MKYEEVINLLEANKNERGIKAWEKQGNPALKSFGLGLTAIKKLAKKVGKDHDLALELWKSEYWDAKQMACMVDEPKKVSRTQVEAQVNQLKGWMATHVYMSNLMPKVACQEELLLEWIESKNDMLRRCAWLMLCNVAKNDKKKNDIFFIPFIEKASAELQKEENFVKDGMNNALLVIGQRSPGLHELCLDAAKEIGSVYVDYGDNSCMALDVVKHLSSPRITNKVLSKVKA